MKYRSRASRKRSGTPEQHDRWLITYADLITLLMIFFVVMYAMSQVDATKYQSLSETLQVSFKSNPQQGALSGGPSLLEGGSTTDNTGQLDPSEGGSEPDQTDQGAVGKEGSDSNGQSNQQDKSENDLSNKDKAVMVGEITEKDLAYRKQEEQLQHVKNMVQAYIDENKLENAITVIDSEKGIEIRLSDSLLFALGQSELTAQAEPTLSKLASLFEKLDTTISIEGHTDNVPMSPGSRFKDNWALSAERALSVLRYFVKEESLKQEQFQIAGYGETRPVDTNETADGRKKNRRVEIIILRTIQPMSQ
ncbi:OmpA/MotB family protein [Paenibacillus sp. 1001270B_150601_E10]|uniref:OmpA/MotB family protein n=1 Tax=Paenibacillus sp. 1001270B_150601_E10 TaxID=2787079 RepID=UPI00189E7BF5|nr:flagellar motor protein MotB [Paenibacillus sp. 1001270B_150601_E10]